MAKSKRPKPDLLTTTAAPKRPRKPKSGGYSKPARTFGGAPTGRTRNADGKHLVIVESPTKAKTINKYLGPDYVVMASVGHVRDLPSSSAGLKGKKRPPVPGVDLEHDFKPTYEIMPAKRQTVADLKRVAKTAADVWFATDLDREGEAIAWHLAQALDVPLATAKRVVFNAITKAEIQNAFNHPRPIDENKVNAQQARRILDRIVGYQVSPLLWKKVAGGLSAGRVQSVAVRLVVEREREIEAFVPEEYWKITGYFTPDLSKAEALSRELREWLASADKDEPRTIRERIGWASQRGSLRAEMVEFDGKEFKATDREEALAAARKVGFALDKSDDRQDEKGRGPAKYLTTLHGHVEQAPRYGIHSIQTKRVSSRPPGPFITSTLQQNASTRLGFPLQRTMRVAQQLYEGIDLKGMGGPTGLITYMRTDSTHLSGEALNMARSFIERSFGAKYLPEKPNFYASSNKAAQEAHEAIRPTDAALTPDKIKHFLNEEQFKLYRMVWERFVACQMVNAEWDSTTVLIAAGREGTGTRAQGPEKSEGSLGPAPLALFKSTGRSLVFDGYLKVSGVPNAGDEALLPPLKEAQPLAPLHIDPTQHFTSPPPRFNEASLQKKLEEEGIGRPSTYAAIISTIQDRGYVSQLSQRDRRLYATDLGKVVTDKLVEAFPTIMDVAYTREMEGELDKIEEEHHDWVKMLRDFYGPFKQHLDTAHGTMVHAKAETEESEYTCPDCKAPMVYRFGKSGRFLSCGRYPDCKYAVRIDREGKPQPPELSDIACPLCKGPMSRRVGKFGPFLGCQNYPACKGIVKLDAKKGVVVAPKVPPLLTDLVCAKCGSPLNLRRSARGPWLSCSAFPKCRGRMAWSAVEPEKQAKLEAALSDHERANPQPKITTIEGREVGDDYVPQVQGGEKNTEPPRTNDEATPVDDAA